MDNLFDVQQEGNVENVFESLDEREEVKVEKKLPSNKKERLELMKAAFRETRMTDPDFDKKLNTWSDSIEVIHTLGYSDKGNFIVDKEATEKALQAFKERQKAGKTKPGEKPKKVYMTTSQIVGYRIKNVGEESIPYVTMVWTKNKEGKYEGTKVEKTLEPGEVVDLARLYMTRLCARPEISFRLANGTLVRGTAKATSAKEELESYYFKFETESGKQVNDDSVKLNIRKVGEQWVVKLV